MNKNILTLKELIFLDNEPFIKVKYDETINIIDKLAGEELKER